MSGIVKLRRCSSGLIDVATVQWAPAGQALGTEAKWHLLAGLVLVEAAVWTPVAVRIAAVLGLVALAVMTLRADGAQSEAVDVEPVGFAWLFGAIGVAAVAIGWAYLRGVLHPAFGSGTKLWFYPGYVLWAMFQEVLLQGIFLVSIERWVGTKRAMWLAAAVFAVAHVPNVFLMVATFAGGLIFTKVFVATRNYVVTGAVHAVLGLALAVTAPAVWTHGMLVGLSYVQGHAWTGATVR